MSAKFQRFIEFSSNLLSVLNTNLHEWRDIGVKPSDHKFLFDLVNQSACIEHMHHTDDGKNHYYRYLNQIQLNKKHPDFKTNFIEYWETDKKRKQQHFSWITDIQITNNNVFHIMRGGRSNWRIENNTLNTLKNQHYHFSHNFGHGYQQRHPINPKYLIAKLTAIMMG